MHRFFLYPLLILANFICAQELDFSNLMNLNIRNVGPANMSGRITTIDAVESDPNTMYVGAASGGVWKSENGGSAWKPVFDGQPTQNIGAIAIQQSNPSVIWVGTGEGNPRNSMNLGMGIFKSLDGGNTWKHLGLEATKTIHRIVIDPHNPDLVYVGASGDPFNPNPHRGLYKTEDGGITWNKILFSNNLSGIGDLVMDPENPNKLIAALYEHRRTPYSFTTGGPGSGIYMTYDAGVSWTKISEQQGIPGGELGRVGLAIAPSDPNRVYAKIEAKTNKLFRSDDGGMSWDMINDNPRFTNNRPFYFQDLAVDSKDPNRLYNIYQPLWVSYDGGKSFDSQPMIPADETLGIHADFHAFWVNPNNPKQFIIGGDGGLGITQDHGKTWYFPENIPVAQCYHINVDNDRPYNVYAGMQDNGNWSGPGYTWKRGGIRTLYWQYLVGGDGFYIEPDEEDSRFGFGNAQNGDLHRYDKLTGYYTNVKPYALDLAQSLRFNWNAAFAKNPYDKNSIYYGSQYVHKTEDKGATWTIISPDLTTDNQEHQKGDYGGLTLDISGAENYNSLLAIAPSPIDENVIWTGSDDGQLHITQDGGENWKNLTDNISNMPHEAWIARIQASDYKAGSAWVIVNNYRKGDYDPYLFKTDDYGKTWKELVNGKNVKGYSLALVQDPIEPDLVFLGTENGLWISINGGEDWGQFKNGFPSVSTMDLKIQESESALIIGTFGRAIWILDDLSSVREIAGGRIKEGISALPINDAVQVKGIFIAAPGNVWSGFNTTFEGENRDFQKTKVPYFISHHVDTSQIVIAEVYNDRNELINTISSKPTAQGLNYLIWNLDEKIAGLSRTRHYLDSRGIPALPGKYKIVIQNEELLDSSFINVLPDPRFDLAPEVDIQLYDYQKKLDDQVALLSNTLLSIDNKMAALTKLESVLGSLNKHSNDDLFEDIKKIKVQLDLLIASGRGKRPDRQISAYQSSVVTPYSRVGDVQMVAMSSHRSVSDQEWDLLDDARKRIEDFGNIVMEFENKEWKLFVKQVKESNIQLFDLLD